MSIRPTPDETRPALIPGSAAVPASDEPRDGLTEEDLRDIESLLQQQTDLTRQDMPARSFEQMLERFQKKP